MSQSESPGSAHPNSPDPNLPTDIDIEQWIEKLQHSHQLRSQMMSLNAWTLAETMDLFLPGFWHRFMTNRQTALKQFLGQKQANASQSTPGSQPSADSEPKEKPL